MLSADWREPNLTEEYAHSKSNQFCIAVNKLAVTANPRAYPDCLRTPKRPETIPALSGGALASIKLLFGEKNNPVPAPIRAMAGKIDSTVESALTKNNNI